MKRIIKSLAVVIAVGAIAGYSTYSFFSDTETSTGNIFTAGAIDLKIDSQCSYNGQSSDECGEWELKDLVPTADKFFNFSEIEPGDFGENTISLHVNNNDAWACLTIDNLQNNENECNEAEEEAGDTTCGSAPDQGELAQNLFFTAWKDDGDNVWEDGELLLFSNKFGPASDILNGKTYTLADSTTGAPIPGGQTQNIGIKWCFGTMTVDEATHTISCDGSATGNKSQTDSLSADIKFYVEQAKNNSQFTCASINGGNGSCVPTEEICDNGLDDDCDGLVDCGDDDCDGEEICEMELDGFKTVMLENKYGATSWETDETFGELSFNESGPTFDYNFNGHGLTANTNFSLIYYADCNGAWPCGAGITGNTGALLGSGMSDSSGNLNLSANMELNSDLPNPDDENYPGNGGENGAKIWLVLSGHYDTGIHKVTTWQPAGYLFDTEFISYDDTDVVSNETITLNNLNADPQYGYTHDYGGANVSFAYDTPADDKLSGTVTAAGLKPYATYQLKFNGRPTCQYGASGDDALNEYLGYKGRWWDNTANANTSDAGYVANHAIHCITGYLVWGYVTADASGNVTKAVQTDSSYHVLWCSGGTCGQSSNNLLEFLDPAYPALKLCQAGNVNGQIERGSCGSLTFDPGEYKFGMVLNEESFHQGPGTWTAVMANDINFKIN